MRFVAGFLLIASQLPAQGASRHWSLEPLPDRVAVPAVRAAAWCRNEIDRFVLARLEREGIEPSAAAGKRRLARRAFLTVTGLPPAVEDVEAFVADTRPDAYERLVGRLLGTVEHAEHMTRAWLDLARYADTYGYQADVYREVWPWRDWVIRSFARNQRFDEFVTWQLAGDLLPNATREQVLATAFNRLHRQTNEGGSIEEEFRVEYVADRVATFGTTFLGMTLGCARCHDHKFDPIPQRDYYRLFAFFQNVDESGLYSHFTNAVPTPALDLPTARQEDTIAKLTRALHLEEDKLVRLGRGDTAQPPPLAAALSEGRAGAFDFDAIAAGRFANGVAGGRPGVAFDGPRLVAGLHGKAVELSGENNVSFPGTADFTRHDPFTISLALWCPDHKARAVVFQRSRAWTDAGSRGYELLLEDGRLSAALVHFWPGNALRIRAKDALPLRRWTRVAMTYDGSSRARGLRLYVDGKPANVEVVRDKLTRQITGGGRLALTLGQRFRDRGFKGGRIDDLLVYNRRLGDLEVAALHLPDAAVRATGADLRELRIAHDPACKAQRCAVVAARKALAKQTDAVRQIMVMREEATPRPAWILKRGSYADHGARIACGTPEALPPVPRGAPRNRLGLARWLTGPRHPLLARVTVNRIWQMHFGRGLVRTSEDFGTRGDPPSHPHLLDWLARSFIDSGWDLRRLHTTILCSATFRQDSMASSALAARDSANVLLARGPSYRLPAETIRDAALAVSGLLVEKVGGPPVRPYQPPGLWKEKSGHVYTPSKGEGLWRRSLYTYWKRTSPPPSMMLLDAAKRDVCQARRQRTMTPLQALVLWNDPQFVEAARVFAERILHQSAEDRGRLAFAFEAMTSRLPTASEATVLAAALHDERAYFARNEAGARQLVAVGARKVRAGIDVPELASWTMVASLLFGLDEFSMQR